MARSARIAVAKDPESQKDRDRLAGAHHNLALLLTKTGRLSEAEAAVRMALAIFERLAADYPETALYRWSVANSLICLAANLEVPEQQAETYQKAVAIAEQLVAQLPDTPRYRQELSRYQVELGRVLSRLDRLNEAEDAHKKGLVIAEQLVSEFPDKPLYRSQLGGCQMSLGNVLRSSGRPMEAAQTFQQAVDIFERLAADDATYRRAAAVCHYGRASALSAAGQYDEAITSYREAIRLDDKEAYIYVGFAWLLANCPDLSIRHPTLAIENAEQAIKLEDSPRSWETLGASQYRAGNWHAAITAFEKSLELRTAGESFDWFFLAMAHWQLGKKGDARMLFDLAVDGMDKNQPPDIRTPVNS